MSQSGGSAAINGFLYQILHHLAWVADIQITDKVAEQDVIKSARLILEPREGGDARLEQVEGRVTRLVEQYKARTTNEIWSTTDVIKEVLPDLRFSVPEPYADTELYRFVTDGRGTGAKGRRAGIDEFKDFLARVKKLDSFENLDEASEKNYGSKGGSEK